MTWVETDAGVVDGTHPIYRAYAQWERWVKNTREADWRRSKHSNVPRQDREYACAVEDAVKAEGIPGCQFRRDLTWFRREGMGLEDAVNKVVADARVV